MLPEGMKGLELSLPQLLLDLGPDGPKETESTFIITPAPGGCAVTWGWSASMKSDLWLCVVLCRWLLERRDDAEAMRKCSDDQHRYDLKHMKESLDGICLNQSIPRHYAAGNDERCLDWLEQAKFKPPAKPTLIQTERAMAYILAKHRQEGLWSDADIARAWQTFLKTCVPQLLTTSRTMQLALWMKLAFWDQDQTMSPEAAYLKLYDYLPAGERKLAFASTINPGS
jgi:hypothetical protein